MQADAANWQRCRECAREEAATAAEEARAAQSQAHVAEAELVRVMAELREAQDALALMQANQVI